MYGCTILADSLNTETGDRVTTMLVEYPLIVHAEFLRHRSFSYSVASNRAIPVKRLIAKVKDDPFVPERFPKAGPGMAPEGYLEGEDAFRARTTWLLGRDVAVSLAELLADGHVHKEIANRLMAPYQWVTQLTTGDQHAYRSFFDQRCHPDAQDQIATIARMMDLKLAEHEPTPLAPGDWHLPFADHHDEDVNLTLSGRKAVSVARAARTSYCQHDGTFSLQKDYDLHDRLLVQRPPHFSPFEHQLQAQPKRDVVRYANVSGFKSYRYQLEEGTGG